MLLLGLFAVFLPASLAVKCYICSWSPKDAANRTVVCHHKLFEANAVAISDCESGCETYTHWDINGVLEHVRRNCLQPETELTGDCKSDQTILYSSERCTCNSNLCNTGSILNVSLVVPITLLALLLILLRLYRV